MCDMMFALKCEAPIFCDSEDRDVDPAGITAKFDEYPLGKGCVLLTAFGQVPTTGDVFVQYDPIPALSHFSVLLGNLSSGNPYKYNHIVLFLYSAEVDPATEILQAKLPQLQLKKMTMPNTTQMLVSLGKMRSLLKKVFTLNQKAFEAYRSLMQIYTRLHPTSVYNVKNLDLAKVAQQFGFDEAPLLDLRTKDTPFRPKEDFYKAAMLRLRSDRREVKEYAAQNIVGEGPEEEEDIPANDE